MKTTITKSDFQAAFTAMNRENNFSYEGLSALFDYFEEYENDTGISIELDVIAICCEFTEYENIEEFQGTYGSDYETIEDIGNSTSVIMVDNDSFIIQDF